jgi:hypothetical protein
MFIDGRDMRMDMPIVDCNCDKNRVCRLSRSNYPWEFVERVINSFFQLENILQKKN